MGCRPRRRPAFARCSSGASRRTRSVVCATSARREFEIEALDKRPGEVTASSPRSRLVSLFSRRVVWVLVTLLLAVAATVVYFTRSRAIGPLQFTQITDFSDSATAASLSPDGRMVTFIRGGTYFQSRGEIYVKVLPNGEAVRLTNDPRPKFGPVFTPDGSRIAYSVIDEGSWDTWTVPVLGGQPKRILPNASGLTWMTDGRVLFSEIKPGSGLHMGIVTATEVRADSREIYFPEHERAMAHYSYASPDRKWVLIVEMGPSGGFTQPCRVVPLDGSSTGRLVGPQGACRSAAWSPDGRWMYFGAVVDDRSHLWRQAFPNGTAEQITFDPTEEEGITVAPDGSSLLTSVGQQRSAVWIHDEAGDRQITSEGSARLPRLSPDGRHVFYLQGDTLPTSELRRVDLASGHSEALLPGWSMSGYEVSPDATEVAFTSRGRTGELEIWLASLDRRSPPREVTRGGDQPSFGPNGSLIFRQMDKQANYLYRINRDGSGRERVLTAPILNKTGVSPDGEWVVVNKTMTAADTSQRPGGDLETVAIPLRGGAPRRICGFNCLPNWSWSTDGRFVYAAAGRGRTMVIPVPPGRALPDLPASGISSLADALALPGGRVIEQTASPGPNPTRYVFLKTEIRRNLFTIRLR